MERLVTTSQAADILGLSLQGIHYRIKKNQLKSIKKSGKTFVYIDEDLEIKNLNNKENTNEYHSINNTNDYTLLIEAKNEQIELLKNSIKWMKKQYSSEIHRLEKNQKKIIKVFNSEIELLQSAFNEMRSIYKNQPQITTNQNTEDKIDLISLKDFFILMKKHNKNEKEIKVIIFKAIKNGDKRFIYNKSDKKILILNDDFADLI